MDPKRLPLMTRLEKKLADLGVGTAIIYALYKPIARQDTKKIQALIMVLQPLTLLTIRALIFMHFKTRIRFIKRIVQFPCRKQVIPMIHIL